jgi:hypothetical protein
MGAARVAAAAAIGPVLDQPRESDRSNGIGVEGPAGSRCRALRVVGHWWWFAAAGCRRGKVGVERAVRVVKHDHFVEQADVHQLAVHGRDQPSTAAS